MSTARRSIIVSLALGSVYFFAFPFAAQAALYAPGVTLDPGCSPTDNNCGISTVVASSTANSIPYYALNGSILSATSSLTILQNGNFGIGTTSPFETLSVAGNAYISGTTTVSNLITASGPEVNVLAYGAKGDGVTNDSAAFNAAIASFAGKSGTVIVPSGKYAINITLTQRNVRIEGQSFYGGSSSNALLVPYTTSLPVIQIGNDTDVVDGVELDNIGINATGPNGQGTTGLYLGGGAERDYYNNLWIQNFTSYGLKLEGGSTYPVEYQYFDNLTVWMPNASGIAGIGLYYPTGGSWTTADYFNNVSVSGGSSGYAIELDGAVGNFSNMWVQALNNHGIHFLSTSGNTPQLNASNVQVDSDFSTDNLVTGYNTDGVLADYMTGSYTVDGYYVLSNGSSTPITGTGALGDKSSLAYPFVQGTLSFADTGQNSYNQNFNINANSGELWLTSNGNLRFDASTTASSQSIFNTGVTVDGNVTALGGNLVLDNGQSITFKDSGGTQRPLIAYTSSNNLQFNNTASTGSIQFQDTNASGGIQFNVGPSFQSALYVSSANGGGRIGIGSTSPFAQLSVNGLSNGTTALFAVASSSASATTTVAEIDNTGDALFGLGGGSVGVGTTTPGTVFSIGTTNGINFSTATSTFNSIGGINLASGCFAMNGICLSGTGGGGSGTVGSGSQGWLPYYGGTGTTLTATSSVFLTPSGNFGIGTTSPFAELSVMADNGSPNTTLFAIGSTASATTTLFAVTNVGNVGIGSATAPEKLYVSGGYLLLDNAYGIKAKDSTGAEQTLFTYTAGDNFQFNNAFTAGSIQFQPTSASGGIQFNVGPGFFPALSVGSSNVNGRVGIATSSPFAQLAVNGKSNGTTPLFAIASSSASATTTAFEVDQNGNALLGLGGARVGVGSTSPATLFEVGGNTANVTFDGYLNCSGFTTNANGLISCTASDERLKQDITPLDASSTVGALNSLNPVSFYWNPETQRGTSQQYGLIAQQVEGVFPNLVSTTSPTDLTPDGTLTVNYDGLIAPLITAFQYLSDEIAGFAHSITTDILDATTVNSQQDNTQQLCVGGVCVTGPQLQLLLEQNGQEVDSDSASGVESAATSSNNDASITADSTASSTSDSGINSTDTQNSDVTTFTDETSSTTDDSDSTTTTTSS